MLQYNILCSYTSLAPRVVQYNMYLYIHHSIACSRADATSAFSDSRENLLTQKFGNDINLAMHQKMIRQSPSLFQISYANFVRYVRRAKGKTL